MVVYLLCFDLSDTCETQYDQLAYWMDFLNSALPLPQGDNKYNKDAKWVILPVGLRSDLQQPEVLEQSDLDTLTASFPRLPIFPQLYYLSSVKSETSVAELKNSIEAQCERIFATHAVLIPTSYRDILRDLRDPSSSHTTQLGKLFKHDPHGLTFSDFCVAMEYLHAIGKIVLLKKKGEEEEAEGGLVYSDANVASAIAASFVSPKKVRMKLRQKYGGVEILDKEQVGYLLNIKASTHDEYVSINFIFLLYIKFYLITGFGMTSH
jgi:hypothetical protein